MTEFERKKREIDVLMAEYEQDIAAALCWFEEWKQRQEPPPEFRCFRRERAKA